MSEQMGHRREGKRLPLSQMVLLAHLTAGFKRRVIQESGLASLAEQPTRQTASSFQVLLAGLTWGRRCLKFLNTFFKRLQFSDGVVLRSHYGNEASAKASQ